MRLTVACTTCRVSLGSVDLESPNFIDAILVMCHTVMPHTGAHALTATVDDAKLGAQGDVHVVIKCLQQGCAKKPPSEFRVPKEYVGAVTLLHHSAHEAHPMELSVDGVMLKLPTNNPP
jgi:hypothetical protein